MTKSKFAFLCNLETLIGEECHAFFWTFTFPDLRDFPLLAGVNEKRADACRWQAALRFV